MAILRQIAIPLLLVSCGIISSCATGTDEPGGGAFNLPHIDVVPVLIAEDPVIYAQKGTALSRPWARSQEAGVDLWMSAKSGGNQSIISLSGQVFQAQEAWENGSVSDPCLAKSWLIYTGGEGAGIGLAEHLSDQWQRRSEPILTPTLEWENGSITHPSLVVDALLERTLLFYIGGKGAAIGVAAGNMDAEEFKALSKSPALTPVSWTKDENATLTGASVYLTLSALGRPIYGCLYSQQGAIGYAAGFEPTKLDALQVNPILEQSGFNLSDPMRLGNYLLHVRNLEQYSPKEGRVIGAATFLEVLSLDLFIE